MRQLRAILHLQQAIRRLAERITQALRRLAPLDLTGRRHRATQAIQEVRHHLAASRCELCQPRIRSTSSSDRRQALATLMPLVDLLGAVTPIPMWQRRAVRLRRPVPQAQRQQVRRLDITETAALQKIIIAPHHQLLATTLVVRHRRIVLALMCSRARIHTTALRRRQLAIHLRDQRAPHRPGPMARRPHLAPTRMGDGITRIEPFRRNTTPRFAC